VEQELSELEAQLLPLRDWKTNMDQFQAILASSPADSLEARNARNDIDMAMATLRYLLSNAGANRARSHLAIARAQAPSQSMDHSAVSESQADGQLPQDSITMGLRQGRVRESIQREEARLEFLRQERERQELRNRTHRTVDPALKEQNKKLEEQIRLNETRLEMLTARLQNGQKEESRQREIIATLAQQVHELRHSLCSPA
jgi:hypothetical protein